MFKMEVRLNMAKIWAKQFYHSKKWQDCRRSYIDNRRLIDGATCEHCKERPGYIVDHIVELTPENITNAEVALNHDNLQYLCLDCHNRKTFFKYPAGKFDEEGQPLPK